ncbi:unnamed protein product [Peniophora sp. CBMAI 1063]|nr:unnamed protein product [Peniophora sp. CBMAI 1063]
MTAPSSAHATHRQAARDAWDLVLRSRFDVAPIGLDLLDIELEVLQEQLFAARALRNAHAMACKLPTEVVTSIFLYTQAVWKPSRQPGLNGERMTYGAGWMSVARVCSSWRKVALNTPCLWTNLDCLSFHPDSVMDILSRSKALPLSLTIKGSAATKKALEGWLCGPVNRRTRRLTIAECTRLQFSGWVELLDPAMPKLEVLDINVAVEGDGNFSHRLLPAKFLGRSCPPRLQSLSLYGILCGWDSPLLSPRLTRLLMSTPEDPNVLPSDLTNVLAPLVNLELLALWGIVPPSAGNVPLPVPRESKPRVLDLRANQSSQAPGIPAFLEQHSAWPASNITIVTRFSRPDDALYITATVPLLFSPHENKPLPSELFLSRGSVSILYGECWPRRQWKTKPERMNFFKSSSPGPSTFFRHLDVSYPNDNVLGSIVPLLPRETLEAIYVGHPVKSAIDGEDAWIRHFSPAKSIRRVAGYYVDLLALICALSVQDDGSDGHFTLFPELEVIIFHALVPQNKELGANMGSQGSEDGSEAWMQNHVAFLDLLAVRKAYGKPIKELMVDKAMEGWKIWTMPALLDATSISFF